MEMDRNPGKTREELEEIFKKIFSVDKIIWLKHGLAGEANRQPALSLSLSLSLSTHTHTLSLSHTAILSLC